MRLHALMDGFPARVPPANPEIAGVTHDSRRVLPDDLYVALVGARFDGRHFATVAAAAGAAAVLGPAPAPAGLEIPWVEAATPREWLAPLAARAYRHPERALTLVGVTGTNGKSTTVAVLAALLEAAGRPAGRLGTLGYQFRDQAFDTGIADVRTTPEAPDLFRTLDGMRRAGASAVAMEVSSHALALGRVSGIEYDVAVFTNLTRDHLDFHGDLESYFEAKCQLFDQLAPAGIAVVHVGDPYGRRLAARLPDALTYSATAETADVEVLDATLTLDGIQARLATPRGPIEVESGLLGRYNLENLVCAVAVGEALSLPHAAVVSALAPLRPVTGRLEPVDAGQDFPVLVDYAHTPAALEAALGAMRELAAGRRVAVVFGCGGGRDQGKRAPMGEIAGALSDFAFATSDNPRDEDPLAILTTVESGLRRSDGARYEMIPDRRAAIRAAIALASSGEPWAVLIAGKGHEAVQVIGDQTTPFSDRDEVLDALRTADEVRCG